MMYPLQDGHEAGEEPAQPTGPRNNSWWFRVGWKFFVTGGGGWHANPELGNWHTYFSECFSLRARSMVGWEEGEETRKNKTKAKLNPEVRRELRSLNHTQGGPGACSKRWHPSRHPVSWAAGHALETWT